MATQTSAPKPSTTAHVMPARFVITKPVRNFVRLLFSYGVLTFGALFMLFPVFWMVTSALKPEWQIFIRPPIWIPQYWEKTPAGDHVALLNLWEAENPATGNTEIVIELGTRGYAPMVPIGELSDLYVVPESEISSSSYTKTINDTKINVRKWNDQEVAPVYDDKRGNLVVVLVEDLKETVAIMPLDTGERGNLQIDNMRVSTRLVETEDGSITEMLILFPNFKLTTLLDSDAAKQARLVPASEIGEFEVMPLDQTKTKQVTLNGAEDGERYVVISEASWRPTMQIDYLAQHAFTVDETDIVLEDEPQIFNLGVFPVGTYTDADGNAQEIAVVLSREVSEDETILVMPIEHMDAVELAPSSSLLRPFPETISHSTVRVKDFTRPTVREESIDFDLLGEKVGILGDRQDMMLTIPASAITTAFDIDENHVSRKTHIYLRWSNFADALSRELGGADFLHFIRNSVIVTTLGIIGHLLSCTLVAYAFARIRAPGRNILFALVLSTMMLPEAVTLIPTYLIFRDLDMIDTLTPLFIRDWFGNALLIFLLRQFFSTIPIELDEAARIDGANRWQVFTRIMLPLITPALATVTIFTFLWRWNDLFHAKIFLNSPKNYTVAIGLSQFVGAYEAEFNLLMAAATVAMLPTVLLFFFAQRFFIEGISMTGLKG
ncbi:MAG: ABC transporter permease subunit [Anaerolineae bacterium]|nr:ABC transporter permease subunit [Anaerolineae bacterium]